MCGGSEKSIEHCKSRGWGNSDCTHDEDAGVVCKDERIPGFVESNVIEVSCVVSSWAVRAAHKESFVILQWPPRSHPEGKNLRPTHTHTHTHSIHLLYPLGSNTAIFNFV